MTENDAVDNFNHLLLISQIGGLSRVADERWGDENPFFEITSGLEKYTTQQLRSLKQALHEAVYAPPVRK